MIGFGIVIALYLGILGLILMWRGGFAGGVAGLILIAGGVAGIIRFWGGA